MRRERHDFFNKRVAHFIDPKWSRLGETKNRLHSSRLESQLTVIFSNSKILSASGHDVIHVIGPISYLGFLLWHLWLSHPPHACVNTCTQWVHLTNPCTKRKVLSLTKPKGKIYKTKNDNIKKKSLLNYITIWTGTRMRRNGNFSARYNCLYKGFSLSLTN